MIKVVCAYCHTPIRNIYSDNASGEQVSHGVCENCLRRVVEDLGQPLEEFLDSLAVPVLVVEEDMRVVAANKAAQTLLGKPQSEIGGSLGGEVIGCLHSTESGGCGRTLHCQSCAIRRNVTHTMETGEPCVKTPAYADIGVLSSNQRIQFLISTEKRGEFVLLRIETASEPAGAPAGRGTEVAEK